MRRTRTLPVYLLALSLLWVVSVAQGQRLGDELLDDSGASPVAQAPAVAAPSAQPPAAEPPAAEPPATEPPAAEPPAAGVSPPEGAPAEARRTMSEARLPSDRVPPQQRSAAAAGPTGLDRVWAADPGPQGTLRLRLTLDWFDTTDFPVAGSENQFTGSTLALAWTPLPFLEVFANLRSTSNTNPADQPQLLQTQGDASLGAKLGYFFSDSLAVGLAGVVHVIGSPGRGAPLGDATSAELRALFTTDLLRKREIPFRFHFDASYYFENGEAVFADRPEEPSVTQEWGLQVGRYDRLMLGFAVEAPFHPYANPYVEYRIGTPFLVELDRRGRDTQDFAFASVPHHISAGVRSFVLEHLALDVVARFGLSDQPYTGVPATPPWMLGFGLAYTLDPRPEVVERTVAAAAPPPPPPAPVVAAATGGLQGRVMAADTGAAPKDARVIYLEPAGLSPQLADAQGRFGGYQLPPGPVQLRAEAPGYQPAAGEALIEAGGEVRVELALKPDPAQAKGVLVVQVVDSTGRPLAADVDVGPPANQTGKTFSDRPYRAELAPDSYPVRVEAEGFAPAQQVVIVTAGKPTELKLTLEKGKGKGKTRAPAVAAAPPRAARAEPGPKPAAGALVRRKGDALILAEPVTFEGDSARLDKDGKRVVEALAGYLKRNPRIARVRVEAHTDNQGEPAELSRLSEQRARSVKSWLVRRGVQPTRVAVKGFGDTQPLQANISERARALNRRIEVRILEAK